MQIDNIVGMRRGMIVQHTEHPLIGKVVPRMRGRQMLGYDVVWDDPERARRLLPDQTSIDASAITPITTHTAYRRVVSFADVRIGQSFVPLRGDRCFLRIYERSDGNNAIGAVETSYIRFDDDAELVRVV